MRRASRSGRTRVIFASALPAPIPRCSATHEPDRDRGRLVVGEHQRRQARPRAQPVATAHAGLAVDRDADVVERDRVAADRPLGHAELGRGRASVDDGPALQQLEEGEQSGGGPGHAPDSSTSADKKCPQSSVGLRGSSTTKGGRS